MMISNKVFIRLIGGLGNQLFIYAFGFAYAKAKNRELVIDDLSGFGSSGDVYKSKFSLRGFNIQQIFLSNTSLRHLLGSRYFWFMGRKLGFVSFEPNIYKYNDEVKLDKRLFFEGYWQSYKYFDAYKKEIKYNLQFLDNNNQKIAFSKAEIVNSPNTVAIGLRFYEETKDAATIHNVVDEKYYMQSIKIIEGKVYKPTFVVFSTDIDLAKSIISKYTQNNVIYINPILDREGAKYDLHLMSLCKHYIISNSSMYWWAAYLGEDKDSIVIAPSNAFPNVDCVPKNWLEI